ncbi:MAG TPA: hypothetical protein VFI76_01830, partial [Terrimicrobiaceae bacterium]|nr:hypothetical protein [Terrimicrobiaceae bacterium]
NPAATLRGELKAFGRLQVWLTLLIGSVGFGGLFAVYTYVAPIVTERTGLASTAVPWVLVVIGLGMTVGNLAGGRYADKSVSEAMFVFFALLIVSLIAPGAHRLDGRWIASQLVLHRPGLGCRRSDHTNPLDGYCQR